MSYLTSPVMQVTPQAYGAKGDGQTDDTNSVKQAIQAALTSGQNLYFPAGFYKITTAPIVIDLSLLPNTSTGFTLYGEGQNSALWYQGPAYNGYTGTNNSNSNRGLFHFSYLTRPLPNPLPPLFYYQIRNLSFVGSTVDPTPLLQLGSDDNVDAMNACRFTNLAVNNVGGPGLKINYILESTIQGYFAGGTKGLWLVQSFTNKFKCECLATASGGIGLHMTSVMYTPPGSPPPPPPPPSYPTSNIANTFFSPAFVGTTTTGIQLDTAYAQNNLFVAPWFAAGVGTPIAANQGTNNRLIQPYFTNGVANAYHPFPGAGLIVEG